MVKAIRDDEARLSGNEDGQPVDDGKREIVKWRVIVDFVNFHLAIVANQCVGCILDGVRDEVGMVVAAGGAAGTPATAREGVD